MCACADKGTVVDLFQAEFLQDFLCLRSGISRFFNSNNQDKAIQWDSLCFGQNESLLVCSVLLSELLANVSWLLTSFRSLILHIVSLLLHVIANIDFRHHDFFTASDRNLVISFSLPHLCHSLTGTVVKLLLFDHVVALALLEKSFLLDVETTFHNDVTFFVYF